MLDNGAGYSSGLSFYQEQLAWLREQLAKNRRDPTILVMHIPLGDNTFSKAVKSLLTDAGNVKPLLLPLL